MPCVRSLCVSPPGAPTSGRHRSPPASENPARPRETRAPSRSSPSGSSAIRSRNHPLHVAGARPASAAAPGPIIWPNWASMPSQGGAVGGTPGSAGSGPMTCCWDRPGQVRELRRDLLGGGAGPSGCSGRPPGWWEPGIPRRPRLMSFLGHREGPVGPGVDVLPSRRASRRPATGPAGRSRRRAAPRRPPRPGS